MMNGRTMRIVGAALDPHAELRAELEAAALEASNLIATAYAPKLAYARQFGPRAEAAVVQSYVQDVDRATRPIARALAGLPPPPVIIHMRPESGL